MIRVILGEKGAGNSKRMIEMANEAVDAIKGSIVFIDAEGQYIFDLKRDIRFVDVSQYHIDSPKMFYGFLAGMASQDFDMQLIFVDGFSKIVRHPLQELQAMFEAIERFSNDCGLEIVIGISVNDDVPEYIMKYTE